MQLIKKIVANGLIVLGLSFGLIVSAIAEDFMESLKTEAEQGDASSQSLLAIMYGLDETSLIKGYGYSKAFYWHKKAAEQGYASSQYFLGTAYADGKGVRQDYSKAVYWFKKAAEQNDSSAQFSLGVSYLFGEGVRQNDATAKEWFGRACDNGAQGGCDSYRDLNK